ncbi:hypothetical protein ACFYPX_09430 [Micromonospora zamorensis]|uniref:hypothetical protein n=1 Tax=Micromonospora zamorensis TaxID=709883 RepID=UPI00367EC400
MTRLNVDTELADRTSRGAARRWQSIAVTTGVLAALLAPTTAFGYAAPASTGEYGQPGYTENDTSEYLRTDGVDFREVVQVLRPTEVPVPPGYSFASDIEEFVSGVGGEPAVIQVTAIRGIYAGWAACAWKADWLAARFAGDEPRSAAAVAVLREVSSWPLVGQTDGGGIRQQHRKVAEAAERGDVTVVGDDIRSNCPRHLIRKSR